MTGTGGTATAAVVTTANAPTSQGLATGGDGRVYAGQGDDGPGNTVLDCDGTAAGNCTSRAIPSGVSLGAVVMTVVGSTAWFIDGNGSLDSLASDGTFTTYDAGMFSATTHALTRVGDELWLLDSNRNVLDEIPASDPTQVTAHTRPTPAFADAETPLALSIGAGPDGNVWFTDRSNAAVGFIDPDTGATAEY